MITDNELHSNYKHGGLDSLVTSDKTSLVAAVNEIDEDLATHMADKAQHISGNAACRVYNNANQSIANGTVTAIAFNSEAFDTDTMHDNVTNNTRITIKTAGKYLIVGIVGFEVNTTGYRDVAIIKGGATYLGRVIGLPVAAVQTTVCVSNIADLVVNDYIELYASQTSGGALNVRTGETMLMAVKVG